MTDNPSFIEPGTSSAGITPTAAIPALPAAPVSYPPLEPASAL